MMEYYFATERNEARLHGTMWMNLKNVLLREKKPDMNGHIGFHVYEMSRRGQSTETENRR